MELAHVLEEAVKEGGFESLKAEQQKALEAFVSGKDTFVALRTNWLRQVNYLWHFAKCI